MECAKIGPNAKLDSAGLALGCALFIFDFGAVGMGHGTYLPITIYGAPLSVVPVGWMLGAPFWWTALGWAVSSRRRALALGLLGMNLVCATLFVILGTPMEHGEDQWRHFDRTQRILPLWVWGG